MADGSVSGTASTPPPPSPPGERRTGLADFRHLRAAGFAAGIGFAALVAIVATLFTVNQYLARAAESRVEQTDAVIGAVRRTARLLREVEFNIFREAVHPGSVESGRVAAVFGELEDSVERIPRFVADNPVQLVRADRLRELVRTLPRRDDGLPLIAGGAAEPALVAIDEAEVITRVMVDVENALRRVREEQVERYAERARILALVVFVIGSGIGAAALALAMVLLRRHVALQNEHVAQLALARDAADAANQAKTRFVQAASHDLRQPLHALALFASALRRRVTGDEALKLVGQIDAAIDSMTGMFATLLDVARLEAGVVVPRFRACRLDEIFERLRSEFAHRAATKGLVLRVVPSSATVWTDPTLLENCLRNLLVNAIKFTARGGVVLGARRRNGAMRVTVADSGPGIAAGDRERIFERFVRLPSTAATDGLGLGLAITRRSAFLIRAELGLSSAPGRGTAFWLTVPRSDAPAEPLDPGRAEAVLSPGLELVLIEDDPRNREAMERELADAGVTVRATADREAFDAEIDAYALGERDRPAPDVLMADLDIDGSRQGIAILRAARGRLRRPVPGVIVTGSTDRATIELLRESGLGWLIKPTTGAALRGAVAAALSAGPPVRN